MSTTTVDFPRPLALEYLDHLGALTGQVHAAMEAIGANSLPALEQSVASQQLLCGQLGNLSTRLSAQATPPRLADQVLAQRIRHASKALLELNERYAALLEHSSHSVRLFAGLCSSYAGQVEPGALSAQRTTLSCTS